MSFNCGIIVTTFNRPEALLRTLRSLVALGSPILVVNDGGRDVLAPEVGAAIPTDLDAADISVLSLPQNRGLAGALNIGLSWFLCDTSITHICYCQDDVEVDPLLLHVFETLSRKFSDGRTLLTGHDAKEHRHHRSDSYQGIDFHYKYACRATQMFASRAAWSSVMPIRSKGLGFPKKDPPDGDRGRGSDVDWWIVRDSPKKLTTVCVPGLVRTFLWKGEDSCWANTQSAGEDQPLSRDAIKDWLHVRK